MSQPEEEAPGGRRLGGDRLGTPATSSTDRSGSQAPHRTRLPLRLKREHPDGRRVHACSGYRSSDGLGQGDASHQAKAQARRRTRGRSHLVRSESLERRRPRNSFRWKGGVWFGVAGGPDARGTCCLSPSQGARRTLRCVRSRTSAVTRLARYAAGSRSVDRRRPRASGRSTSCPCRTTSSPSTSCASQTKTVRG
jgi:hypothetical protein